MVVDRVNEIFRLLQFGVLLIFDGLENIVNPKAWVIVICRGDGIVLHIAVEILDVLELIELIELLVERF